MTNRHCSVWLQSSWFVIAILLGLALGVEEAVAQQRVVPPSREAAQYSFAPVVKRAAPAVVNVYVRSRV